MPIASDIADVPTAEAQAARRLAVLRELVEIGMQMARAARDEMLARVEQAEAGVEPAPPAPARFDPGLVYSRIARAVRLTLMLEARLSEGLDTARAERQRKELNETRLQADLREGEVRDYVVEAIEAEAEESDLPEREVERQIGELHERLEQGDYDDALADAPIAELIARICKDLGVTPDWSLWADEPWMADRALPAPEDTDPGSGPPPAHGAPPDRYGDP